MKRLASIAVVVVFALGGCASGPGATGGAVRSHDPLNPKVTVAVGKYIVVDQEPIVIRDKNVFIDWELPPAPSPYRFPGHGIVFANPGGEFEQCAVIHGGFVYRCFVKNTKPGKYKYTISVMDGATPLAPLDPWVFND